MGRAKDELIETMERGWYELDTKVCSDCVQDVFLKSLIEHSSEPGACSYCTCNSESPIVAPINVILPVIARTISAYFKEPADAGVPRDGGGWLVDPIETREALFHLGLECNEDLFEDLAEAFINQDWVPSVEGNWSSLHPHEELSWSWNEFTRIVKHQTRYFFHDLDQKEPWEYPPQAILRSVGALVEEHGLLFKLPEESKFYRVRPRENHANWEICPKEMGAPPNNKARAGRMNPAGISYLYLSFDLETALAEVLPRPPCDAAYAEFVTNRDLTVIDFSRPPDLPSIFDHDRKREREELIFISKFVKDISTPTKKDGNEHIDYVPSQIISEFFAMTVFEGSAAKVQGMIYPSAVQKGGRNLVLLYQFVSKNYAL
ncbi:HEPN-associated N-terminal domain-containing protein [Thiocystis violacea]|uniref:HEPN-associated N-terminal domain-containing protein n=1 Tax=Thiocystis violacea TaxID=13725 RepID=UPI0019030E53|nr:HEPN-associated N-terminal domain-containing protein [Thiocystis violacea]MBK1718856.1 hypothetical protein [Thiocystis violacea]